MSILLTWNRFLVGENIIFLKDNRKKLFDGVFYGIPERILVVEHRGCPVLEQDNLERRYPTFFALIVYRYILRYTIKTY